jgi:hypothetical protein
MESDDALCVCARLQRGGGLHWALYSSAADTVSPYLALLINVRDDPSCDRVSLDFGGGRVAVSDGVLKQDPPAQVILTVAASEATGRLIPVGEVPRIDMTFSVFLVAAADLRRRRGKWKVRDELAEALPAELRELTTGRQSGGDLT